MSTALTLSSQVEHESRYMVVNDWLRSRFFTSQLRFCKRQEPAFLYCAAPVLRCR